MSVPNFGLTLWPVPKVPGSDLANVPRLCLLRAYFCRAGARRRIRKAAEPGVDDAGRSCDELLNETLLVKRGLSTDSATARLARRFRAGSRYAGNGLIAHRSKSATLLAATMALHILHLEPGSIAPSICSARITVALTTIAAGPNLDAPHSSMRRLSAVLRQKRTRAAG